MAKLEGYMAILQIGFALNLGGDILIAQMVKWFIIGFTVFVGVVGLWEVRFKKQCTAKEFYERREQDGNR